MTPDALWREEWKADIRRRARIEIPALLRSVYAQRLQPLDATATPPAIVAVATPLPTTPVPSPLSLPLPETGAIPRLRETAIISAIRLLKPAIDVRKTKELVSAAVRWFFHQYGCLPAKVRINPMRYLTVDTPNLLLALDDACAELGAYTVRIEGDAQLASDVVQCEAMWYAQRNGGYVWGRVRDYYL